MTILSIHDLTCESGIKTLFKAATFSINATDKVAIVGPNGCGKTTLLSLIAKATTDPQSEISTQRGLRITSLDQQPSISPTHTIHDHLYKSASTEARAIQDYHTQTQRYHDDPSDETEAAYTKASDTMDHLNLWEYEDQVASILRELDITDLNQKISALSGGIQKKIALAQTFFDETDLLILDEPTNHLDITTIEWLESMLTKQRSAIMMVTHDRYFLDKICTKIIEIDQQQLFVYDGNYSTYLEKRDQRYHALAKEESRLQSILRVELAWLKRGPKARATKQNARKDRIAAMLDRPKQADAAPLELGVSERRLGKKILELKNISKSFDGTKIIDQFSYTFSKGEKIGILGPNGAGKSTFLNLIMEKIQPDSGEVDPGVNTVFGYFDQHTHFDAAQTVYDHINDIGSHFTCHDGTTLSAAKLLERFLFPSQMLKTPIGNLSGGEKRRLHLVSLLLKNPNFLLFDEPTNDLDIQTLSVLEDFLASYQGCVLLISHDRYFMDRVVTRLLVFDRKKITPFIGNYSDYIAAKSESKPVKKVTPAQKKNPAEDSDKQLKKDIAKLEKEIEALEAKRDTLSTSFTPADNSPDVYEKMGKELKELESRIATAYSSWELLISNLTTPKP